MFYPARQSSSLENKSRPYHLWTYLRLPAYLLMVILLGLVSACTSTGSKQNTQTASEAMPTDEAEQNLWLAQRAISTERADYLLNALQIYLEREDFTNAERTVDSINTTTLSVPQYQRYILLASRLALALNEPENAITYFDEAPTDIFTASPLATQLEAIELNADVLLAANRPLDAAKLLVTYSGLFTGDAYWANHNKIWGALRSASALEITRALEASHDYDWQGWLELINQIRINQYSLELQLQALQQWQTDWPAHSAAQQLPDELVMLSELPNTRPKKIALILPLTGPLEKVGKSIRDGFLAAFYADMEASSVDTEVNVFDSERYTSMIDLYLQIQIEGYDLVIGPLQKEKVAELSQLPEATPPVLALNYDNSLLEPVPGMFQFGLAAEDEIKQILDYLDYEQQTNIAVIYPNAPWAEELIQPLQTRNEESDRFSLLTFEYAPDDILSNGIAELLDITNSDQRFREMRNLFGKIEFEPRRRQDIDAVLLIATPTIARQIKPLLAFHYAADLPVYGTSQIYAGFQQQDKDHDLDNVRFTEIPWLLSQTIPLRGDIRYLAGTNRYERLYAMGIDSYRLAPRLRLMERFPSSQLQGMTGNLAINHLNQIRRQLEWATFDNGRIKTLLSLIHP